MFTFSANGNAFGPGGKVNYFADGGVVGSPTMFGYNGGIGMMGEAGHEAIMPLKRDASGKLGVGTAPVSVEINNYSGGEVTTTESTDDNGNKRLQIMIEKAVNDGISRGRFDKSMNQAYAVNRRGR